MICGSQESFILAASVCIGIWAILGEIHVSTLKADLIIEIKFVIKHSVFLQSLFNNKKYARHVVE